MRPKSSRCVAVAVMLAGGGLAAVGFAGPASAETVVDRDSVQARGVEGGCNTGHLDAWGGTLRVDFTPDAPPIGQPDVPQFQLPDQGFPGPPDGLDVN